MEGLPYYRVKLDDALVQCALEELLELASQGQVRADTLIIPPFSESWQAADTLIELSTHLQTTTAAPAPAPADPWSAWEDMADAAPEEEDEEEDWEDGSTELTMRPIRPPKRLEPPSLPEASIHPIDPDPRSAPPEPSALPEPRSPAGVRRLSPPATPARGKVIAFPGSRTQPTTDGSYALAQHDFPTFTPPPPQAPRSDAIAVLTYSIKWGRLIGLLGAGFAVLAVVWFYIHGTATATFPPHPGAAPIAVSRAPGTPATAPAPETALTPSDSYAAMEQGIRDRMSMDVLDIRATGDLEDAMFIELQRAGLDVASISAEVLRWGGRRGDVPELADFRVRLRSTPGQLDRELGTAAIVIGKYIARYDLSVAHFEVILEIDGREPTGWPLNPDFARELFTQRITLLEFLTGLR